MNDEAINEYWDEVKLALESIHEHREVFPSFLRWAMEYDATYPR